MIGSPKPEDVEFIRNRQLKRYLLSLPTKPKVVWRERYPNASIRILDLLEKLLKFNPDERSSTEECLNHPFVEKYSDPEDEPRMKTPFTYQMETTDSLTTDQLKVLIFEESQKMSKSD